jgi:hypothetical protein
MSQLLQIHASIMSLLPVIGNLIYEVGEAWRDIKFIPNFMKIGQYVQKLKGIDRNTRSIVIL